MPRQAPTVPDTPTNLQVTTGDSIVTLSWTAPSDGGSSITGYTVQQSTDGTTWTDAFTVSGTTATVTGLTDGVPYSFRVFATNSAGDSTASNVVTATTTASAQQGTETEPNEPIYPFFWLTADATEVRLFWSPPVDDGGSEITSYKTQYRIATDTTWTDGPTGLTVPAIIKNLTPNEPYQFRVFAINSIGTSESSLITSATLVPRN